MDCDFVVIGAGIAGASAAYELAAAGRVVVLEREPQPGYHSTGRSAAVYTEAYGNRVIRALARASRPFLEAPPRGFAGQRILSPRGLLFTARADQRGLIDEVLADPAAPATLREIGLAAALELLPALDPAYVGYAAHEPGSMDIDVHALHQGFLRGLRARGGELVTEAEVRALAPAGEGWRVETAAGAFRAPIVVNAAGAWADVVAKLAGARPVGLAPKRRTVITFEPPDTWDIAGWPLTLGLPEAWYFQPDAGRILASPADETPSAATDAQPEEIDVAEAVDRIERATTMTVGRIASKWAGLRSFVADKTPVAGFAPDRPGFFWLAGQGGYGIKTSPALGRIAASLVTAGDLPQDVADLGVTAADLAPARLWG